MDPDRYVQALIFAASAHGGQRTPHGLPYLTHVCSVAAEIVAALQAEPGRDEDLAVSCALLHDVVEDTDATLGQLEVAFGAAVAAGVSALTKDVSLDKPLQMLDSLDRIAAQPPEIAMVKLADRIINLGPPPPRWSESKRLRYRDEADRILDRLGHASPHLARRLRGRIAAYPPDPV